MTGQLFNPSLTHAAPMFTLGCLLWDDAGNAWLYVRVNEDVSAHHCVMVQNDYEEAQMISTSRLNASSDEGSARIGIPRVAIAEDDYGWIQLYGHAMCQTGAISNLESYSYSTSTAGTLDDDSSGAHRTRNVIFQTSGAAGVRPVHLNWAGGVRYV